MRKNSSKWLVIFMALALALVLAGCSTSNNGSGNDNNAGGNSGGNDNNAGGSTEKTVLTAFSEQAVRVISFNDNVLTQKIEDRLGIDIEFQTAPSDGAMDKQNLILASGDYPAAFIGGAFTKVDQLKYGTLGILVPLNDLIEEHAPNIQQVFADNPQFQDGVTAPDGNIYALPGYDGCWHCFWPAKSWINVEWLETLNLDMPTTTEEYEKVLLAFKNDDPNGNGKQDEIPLGGYVGNWGNPIHNLMNAFVYTDPNNFLQLNNGNVDLVADNEEWKQGLKYIKGLYDQGLIEESSFTQNREALQQTAMNEEAIILGQYFDLWNGGVMTIYGEAPDQRWNQYRAVPPLKGPDGVQLATYTGHKVPGGKFAITDAATEAQQIAAIQVADYLYSKEGALDAFQGVTDSWIDAPEGKLGTDGKQALYAKPDTADSDWDAPTNDLWENGFYYMSIDLFHGRVATTQDLNVQAGNEPRLYQDNLKYKGFEPSADVRIPDLFIDPDKSQTAAEMVTVINSYIGQNAVQFVIGQKDLDSDWDAYVKGLEDLDAEAYIEIYQEAYEAYTANR